MPLSLQGRPTPRGQRLPIRNAEEALFPAPIPEISSSGEAGNVFGAPGPVTSDGEAVRFVLQPL